MMRRIHYIYIGVLMACSTMVMGQENRNSVTSRNLDLFGDI